MQRNYCYICGDSVQSKSEGIWWCEKCQQDFYANPKPCVELALFNREGEILLAKRGRQPSKGKFDLPGGFIDLHESAEEALYREMQEELGLNADDFTTPQYLLSYVLQYPWGKETYELLVMLFTARIKPGAQVDPQDDVAAAEFMLPAKINAKVLASDKHLSVIQKAEVYMLS